MSLTTYSGLVALLEKYLNRADITIDVPDFITLFEARMNRLVRVPQMEAQSTSTATSSTVALPEDYLSLREVRVDGKLLEAMNPQQLRELYRNHSGSVPYGYAIVGTSLLLQPAPTTAEIDITYYQKIPGLTATNTSNWLLASHPDIYLYGVLTEAKAYIMDEEQSSKWKGAWDEAMGELMASAVKARLPAGPLVMRSMVRE